MKRVVPVALALFLLCLLLPGPALGEEAEDIAQARVLIRAGKPAEAFALLRESGSEERLAQDPAYTLVFAEAAWRHAPTQPGMVPNGGDPQRELYVGAAELYRSVAAMESASELQKNLAKAGVWTMLEALKGLSDDAWGGDDPAEALRLAFIMAEAAPDNTEGPLLVYDLGVKMKDEPVQLQGLRLLVRVGPEQSFVYSYAATLEATPDVGDGLEAALAHIEAGLAVMPDDLTLLHDHARWLVALQRTDAALKATAAYVDRLNDVEAQKNELAIFFTAAGKLYEQLEQDDKAVDRYQQAFEADPTFLQARYLLGAMHYERGINALLKIIDMPEDAPVDEVAALHDEAVAALTLARPHLEYFCENSEPDLSVMHTLRELYQQLGEDELVLKMNRDIKKVQRGEPIR